MKKKSNIKFMSAVAASVFGMSLILSGCGSSPSETSKDSSSAATTPATTEATKTTASVSGSITSLGSTAIQQLVKESADNFMSKNSGASIQVQGGGSGTGLTQVSSGGADIGNSDIFAEEKLPADKAKELVDHKVCVVGFAAVVNPGVKVDNLTQKQLVDVFTGKIKNWKEIGGDDQEIVIVNRPSGSGTRATFKKYALNGADEAQGKALTEDSSGTVKKVVADTKGAISYLALSYIDNTVKALKYEGTEATPENIASGKYPIWSYEHMYTKGEAKDLAKAFLDYIMSSDVQNTIVKKLKFIPISDMKTSR
jgi:phosphate transport system substrate-binding protein